MHGMTVIPLHNRDHIADSGSDYCRSGICSESHLSHMLHAGSSPGDGDTGENMRDIKVSLPSLPLVFYYQIHEELYKEM